MLRIRVGTAILFVLSLLLSSVGIASADGPYVGIPSANPADRAFVGLAGTGLSTLSEPAKYWIGIPANQTTFGVDIFDGDLGGLWDQHDPLNSVKVQFTLYADPNKTGDPSGKPVVAQKASDSMADNDWTSLYNGPVQSSAAAFSGNFFYLLVAQWDNPAASQAEFNAFKIRVNGTNQVSITPNQTWAFVGGPINTIRPPYDPGVGSSNNAYNGQWDWYFYAPGTNLNLSAIDCDADYRLDATHPGIPPDDSLTPTSPEVRVAPDIRYTIYQPDASILISNLAPSGDTVCETKSTNANAGGLFHWQWLGVDGHNFVYIKLQYETMSIVATPFPVGTASATASPTATVTPTATLTGSPVKTQTGTPAKTATSTPVIINTNTPVNSAVPTNTVVPSNTPVPSGGGGGNVSSAAATNTPVATATITSSATLVPRTPTRTRTPVIIPKLPATGDAGIPTFPIVAVAMALFVGGVLLRRRLYRAS